MNEVPNVISVKDLLYIEDMLNWNFVMIKKINTFIDCMDECDERNILIKAKKMHLKHYKALLDIIS